MDKDDGQQVSAVLLVCVFNKLGKILTHDYFHEIFSPFGKIVRILIFEKAKVWKTFIQFQELQEAKVAKYQLNNRVVFEDGSKLNIFYAKLKSIALQNSNIGGVDYRKLYSPDNDFLPEFHHTRNRSSTAISSYLQNPRPENLTKTQSLQQSRNSSESNYPPSSQQSFNQQNGMKLSKISENQKKSQKLLRSETKSNQYNPLFCDIDQQFKQLALQSQQYREWSEIYLEKDNNTDKVTGVKQKNQQGSLGDLNELKVQGDNFGWLEQDNIQNRKKSKTYLPPSLTNQFIQENIPSRVLFVRSIPSFFTAKVIENIFVNFGKINRLIYLKSKTSTLIEYQYLDEAMQAKDELNYTKCQMKVFYSHYDSLQSRNYAFSKEDGEEIEFRSSKKQDYCKKNIALNPPSSTLYLTNLNPQNQTELIQECLKLNCHVRRIQWKETKTKDYNKNYKTNSKWCCLLELANINESLIIIGFLQGYKFYEYSARDLKISFTRSKITKGKEIQQKRSQQDLIQRKLNEEQQQNPIRIRYNTVSFNSIPQNQQ